MGFVPGGFMFPGLTSRDKILLDVFSASKLFLHIFTHSFLRFLHQGDFHDIL